jgi:ribosomal silencing factor RsfS
MAVIETPPERQWYASYVIVVSGNSSRHLLAMATAVQQAVRRRQGNRHQRANIQPLALL